MILIFFRTRQLCYELLLTKKNFCIDKKRQRSLKLNKAIKDEEWLQHPLEEVLSFLSLTISDVWP